jgi:hypothetical protein
MATEDLERCCVEGKWEVSAEEEVVSEGAGT